MNKLTKLLSVFVIAGAIGTGVAGAVGCQTNNSGHKHDWEYTQISGNAEQHTKHCKADGHTGADTTEDHTWSGDKCSLCDYPKPSESGDPEGYVIPANVTGILIEGVTAETITLSTTKTSHTIDKSAIHVYLATGANADQKSTEVPAANLVLELKDGNGAAVSSWENIEKDGQYKVNASIKDATMASGATATVGDLKKTVTVTISNPVQQNSLVVKTGEGVKTTQVQSNTNEILPTWTFEVTLANGKKQDVPASEVTVGGLVTTQPTDSGVATLTWGTITGTQSYTITADNTKVAQSFAVNFGELTEEQKTKLKTEDVSIQGGRFVVQATSGSVDDHRGSAPEYEDKYLASRLKLGGKYDGDNAKRYVKITTDGSATITVYAYANTGTAGNGDSNRYLSLFKNVTYGPKAESGADANKIIGTGVDRIGEKQNTKQKENTKHEWNVTEAGTYWLVCEDGDVCVTYIQVDQLVAAGTGVEAITLAGETKLAKLSVSSATKDYKQTFTVGDTFSVSEEYTVNGVYYNNVTMTKVSDGAVTTGLTYWLGTTQLTPGTTVLSADLLEKLGENKVTVKVGDEAETTSYTIIVESAVPGVTGITASVKDTVETEVDEDDGTVTLAKTDVEAAIVGENAEATVNVTSVKYRLASAEAGTETEITESVTLGINDYKLVVTAHVAAGEKNADFTVEIDFKVTKKLPDGALQAVTVTFHVKDSKVEGDTDHPVLSLEGNTITSVTVDLSDGQIRTQSEVGCYNTKGSSLSSNKFSKRYITITLKEAGTYKITVKAKTSATGRYVVIGQNTTDTVTKATTEAGNGSFTNAVFENVVISGTTLIIGGDNNIDISEIIIEPVTPAAE